MFDIDILKNNIWDFIFNQVLIYVEEQVIVGLVNSAIISMIVDNTNLSCLCH